MEITNTEPAGVSAYAYMCVGVCERVCTRMYRGSGSEGNKRINLQSRRNFRVKVYRKC